jgi:ubiquinol-cytochrome c reductase cytochrome c1 subunit
MRLAMAPMRTFLAAALVTAGLGMCIPADAAENGVELRSMGWPHNGLFGTFDRSAAQRGFQVYREVCSACHGLKYIAFRHLEQIGFNEEQVRALAAEYTVQDGPNDDGEMFERPGVPSDFIPSPYPNEQAARVANGGALPPDLSLITKARADGVDYLFSLLTGYEDPPEGFALADGMNYNRYFPGHQIAMPMPLSDDQVSYADGSSATIDQMAADVTEFLTWTAEPNLEARKQTGLKVMLFLIVLTALLYAAKRRIWADAH